MFFRSNDYNYFSLCCIVANVINGCFSFDVTLQIIFESRRWTNLSDVWEFLDAEDISINARGLVEVFFAQSQSPDVAGNNHVDF